MQNGFYNDNELLPIKYYTIMKLTSDMHINEIGSKIMFLHWVNAINTSYIINDSLKAFLYT